MNLTIYTLTHKKFEVPPDHLYQPLQVGSALHEDLGYLRDDTGENISRLNCYYSELTGLYWIWKNDRFSDYVGTCHYRRYLINEKEQVLTRQEYEKLLAGYDLITTKQVLLNNSYHYGFSANHNIKALDTTGEVIRDFYPEYYDAFVELVNGPRTYFGNILVTSRPLYDAYCSWLFSIFAEVEKRINLDTDEDAYHKRVLGFISEFLLLVWCRVRKLKVCECKVGMIGEKAETKEIKNRLAEYLRAHDIDGAKTYFMEQHKRRPDILMEASDITGELRLAMQIIATADEEKKRTGKCVLDMEDDFQKLVSAFAKLNREVALAVSEMTAAEDTKVTMVSERIAAEEKVSVVPEMKAGTEPIKREPGGLTCCVKENPLLSPIAVEVAIYIYPGKDAAKETLLKSLRENESGLSCQ